MPGLGRKVVHDHRDYNFPMHLALGEVDEAALPDKKYWEDPNWWGDQGNTEECTGYSSAGWLVDHPLAGGTEGTESAPPIDPHQLYLKYTDFDGDPGAEDGSTIRTAAKVLQQLGYVDSYHWANDADVIAKAILSTGPVLVGTVWYSDMFNPDANHVIKPTGSAVGGHAYLLNGYDSTTKLFRIRNSWGRSWGDNGHGYIAHDDFDLLMRQQGEAALLVPHA